MKNMNKKISDFEFLGVQTLAASMLQSKDITKNQRNSILILTQSDLFICGTLFMEWTDFF